MVITFRWGGTNFISGNKPKVVELVLCIAKDLKAAFIVVFCLFCLLTRK